MELETPIPLYCEEHGWQFARSWKASGYTLDCGCVLSYKASCVLRKEDYDALKIYSQHAIEASQ